MPEGTPAEGIDPERLDDEVLIRELEQIHRTRHETLLYGTDNALKAHSRRMLALEAEYLRRHPERQVVSSRTRDGSRARAGQTPKPVS
ncbi:DUF6158 family protein [Wenjunlia tyrosinilytica]|uniref:Uncharacterized protein n=1 Tax=Wenjunlia tyrosinilytica TaxID=1544741 RepID=A0A917ZVI6_9ACTN|nr:DUF6158 family protein [Wenjunlia tyrosinilytica]GGO95294.1 hypothetical protein GCM10012280_52150 [Wenjunlia tyrosinilytica]